ncbi:MAG: histidine kinase [Oleiphilaceae bacterium]|nr:histidine kinase [Oleiphilaceae bacterium]
MNNKATAPQKDVTLTNSFIPNLCHAQSIAIVILCTQVLAFIIALIQTTHGLLDWQTLGFTSLILHAIGLSSCVLLCAARPINARFSIIAQAFLALLIVILVTALISYASIRFVETHIVDNANFIIQNTIVAGLISGLALRYFYLGYLAKQQQKAELQARIEALQSRIRPHFLFNSMNSIASLIATKPELAEDAVLDLSELFRSTLNTQRRYVALQEEISLCKKYLNIEGLRLGDRLRVSWKIADNTLQVMIPPLTLQPIVENAIYHGIQPLADGGTIDFEAYIKNEHVYLLVSNPVGESEKNTHGNHIALSNIADRLSAMYKKTAVLKTSQHNNIFTTTLRLPIQSSH